MAAGCAAPLAPGELESLSVDGGVDRGGPAARDAGRDGARPLDGGPPIAADAAAPDLEADPCAALADGTLCMPTADPCRRPGTCAGGVCGAVSIAPDGTVCAATNDPCQTPGTCSGGACSPIAAAPDGTVCDPAATPCRTDGTCKAGQCGPQGTRPDGYNYDLKSYVARCCSGAATTIDTNANCGACGTPCGNGSSCILRQGEYYCSCNSNASCWSGCCSTFYGAPDVCAASDCTGACIPCRGGASCVNGGNTQPNYCKY